jgi:hypothetical protein
MMGTTSSRAGSPDPSARVRVRLLLELVLASWVFVMLSFGGLLLRETFRRDEREPVGEDGGGSAAEDSTATSRERVP